MMKKRMRYYVAVWLIALAMFNIITFVIPGAKQITGKYTAAFWVGYAAVILAFIGQLACSWVVLKEENKHKLFYRISLITVSYVGLIVTLVVGALCMAIAALPYWIGIVAGVLVLGATWIAVIKATAAANEVEHIDQKIDEQTQFIRLLTAEAAAVTASAKSFETKEQAKKIHDAIRYSDPMSNSALRQAETQISDKFTEFASAVKQGDAEESESVAEELLVLIGDRNQKCKLLK